MTREEAKAWLEHHLDPIPDGTKQSEAVSLAIKALEQEPKIEKVIKMRDVSLEERESINKYIKSISRPTGVDFWNLKQEPCDDAISRQAVLDLCDSKDPEYKIEHLKEDVECLPPVNPQEPKTGYWIDKDVRGSIEPYCSICNEGIDTIYHYNFCPNCGAKMGSNV